MSTRAHGLEPGEGRARPRRVEFAVVGAGPAGASLAIRLARAGREVLLIDRTPPPRDKLCGEFLSPESAADLEDLGLSSALGALAAPAIARARFTVPSGRSAAFALPAPGRGLSRLRLDALLWERARSLGVETVVGEITRVTASGAEVDLAGPGGTCFRAKRLIAAHGRYRRLDRALPGADSQADLRRFAGIKRHHRPSAAVDHELENHVEIHVFPGGYCGMSHVEGGLVNVCALVDTAWLRRQPDRSWPALFKAMAVDQPGLEARRRDLEPVPDRDMVAVGAIDLSRRRAVAGPALVVGDASAVIAPLAGDGQAMALSGARRLAELLLAAPDAPFDALAARWRRRFHRVYGPRLAVARALQGALWRPAGAEALVRSAGLFPGLAPRLARWTREPGLAPEGRSQDRPPDVEAPLGER